MTNEVPYPVKDERGNRYGMLVAIEYVGIGKRGGIFLWRCDCGNEKEIPAKDVRAGNIRSCGCQAPGRKGRGGISFRGTSYRSRQAFAEAFSGGDAKKRDRILYRLRHGYSPESAIAADRGSLEKQRLIRGKSDE